MITTLNDIGPRRILISLLLACLAFSALTAEDTWITSAQASNCTTDDATWMARGGEVPIDVARIRFGASYCVDPDGSITEVTRILEGGVEGIGSSTGWVMENRGTWVESQARTYVHIRGRTTLKICIATKSPACSPTDTQTFDLKIQTTQGPYKKGTEPGIWASSQTCYLGGGCAPGITFVRID
jgi:hypothetical protein